MVRRFLKASSEGAPTAVFGSWFQAVIVAGKKEHWTCAPGWINLALCPLVVSGAGVKYGLISRCELLMVSTQFIILLVVTHKSIQV